MINFSNVTFIKSAPGIEDAPKGGYPEVLIVGKSNVGKSSLINALCQRKALAFTSSKPGHTRLLNYYDVDHRFYLVDAPGYGYAKGSIDLDKHFGEMMSNYLKDAKLLSLVLLLIDSRREFSENDIEILDYLKSSNIPFLVVITKMDKINQKERALMEKRLVALDIQKENVCLTSSRENRSLESLKTLIEKAL